MKNRLTPALILFVLILAAGTALADKKTDPPSMKLTRAEGKPAEFSLNPTGLTIERTVSWEKATGPGSQGQEPVLEFTSPDPMTITVELAFDAFETKENVYEKFIRPIEGLALVDDDLKRPPMILVVWGGGFPKFQGVIESLSVKYTMFLPDGTPCRATVNLRMRSASRAEVRTTDPCP